MSLQYDRYLEQHGIKGMKWGECAKITPYIMNKKKGGENYE